MAFIILIAVDCIFTTFTLIGISYILGVVGIVDPILNIVLSTAVLIGKVFIENISVNFYGYCVKSRR